MNCLLNRTWPRRCLLATAVVLIASAPALLAAERSAGKRASRGKSANEQVELFAAVEAGLIEVSFVPRDSTEATVRIKNNTKRPLTVQLPEAFAATPVLAQFGGGRGGGMGGGGMGGGGMGGGGQGMGGGMGGMGMGGGGMGGMGMGGGGGFFNVAAEKVGRFKVACVCLEHGKKEPRPAIEYELKPLDSFSTDPQLAALMSYFGRANVDQRAVQAAAWHLANGMSWQELAAKQIEYLSGPNEPYFSPQQLHFAQQLVAQAEQYVAGQPRSDQPAASPGEQPAAGGH